MDDGEVDSSSQCLFNGICDLPGCSMDDIFQEIWNDTDSCTHTHVCNPPGPDSSSHTHTCFHIHTQTLASPSGNKVSTDDTAVCTENNTKKRPTGNAAAVKRYRDRKRAQGASLQVEVVRLRAAFDHLKQQFLESFKREAALKDENSRLKCLLVEFKGRIEGEIGSFRDQKSVNNMNLPNPHLPGTYVMNPCHMHSDHQVNCLHPGVEGNSGGSMEPNWQGYSDCELENMPCMANQNSGV